MPKNSKLHHYVPRFYLRRFANENGLLWVWDKHTDGVFRTIPDRIAAEKHFYKIPELAEAGHDADVMERQL